METLIIKNQKELSLSLNNNQYKNILDIEKLINAFIIESIICQKFNNENMNDRSHFMTNLKADGNNQRVTTIDEKIKENFLDHSENHYLQNIRQ